MVTMWPAPLMEPAAARQPMLQADFIERNGCAGSSVNEVAMDEPFPEENVYVSALNRNTEVVRAALCEGASLKRCREELESEGHPWKLPSGALIFVNPLKYICVMNKLDAMSVNLTPSSVVYASSLE